MRWGRRAAAVAFVATLAAAPADPAAAHDAAAEIRAELGDVGPAFDGMTVEIATSIAPQLVVANPTPRRLEILDDDGTPFLRIGARGVEANVAAEAWYTTNDPFGTTVPQERVKAEPRWERVADESSWGWFDHRLHPPGLLVPPGVAQAGVPAELAGWAIPVRVDGEPAELTGRLVYRPVRGTFEAALTSPLTPVEGVTVSVLQGRVPGLFVDNATDEVVTVTGAAGEPFVRIGPDGVEANLRSPTWVEALQAEGGAPAVAADADARPRWSRIAKVPRYGWKEYRALYPDDEPPEDVVRSAKPTPLREWTVPMTIGGETFEVAGVTTWQPLPAEPAATAAPAGQPGAPPQAGAPAPQPASPPQGRSPAGRLGAGAALVGVAAVAYLLARRRAA